MKMLLKKTPLIFALGMSLGFAACAAKEEEEKKDEVPSEVTISGKLSLATTSLNLLAGITDYKLYCVTFEETPRAATSDFSDEGAFSVKIPSQVQIGCFVNDKTTNKTQFTFQFETGGESKMGGASSTNGAAFKGDLDLGDLTVNANGNIVIPAAKIADKKATIAGLNLDDLHEKSFTMTCVPSGNAEMDERCTEDLMDGGTSTTVYFRVLKAKEGGADVMGLAAWRSKEAFEGCGSIDLTQAEADAMEGVEFTNAQIGAAYADDAACVLRDEGNERTRYTLKDYYIMAKASSTGVGYAVNETTREDHGGGCDVTHSTAIEFSGSASLMTGAFVLDETRLNCSDEGQESIPFQRIFGAFNVKFEPK